MNMNPKVLSLIFSVGTLLACDLGGGAFGASTTPAAPAPVVLAPTGTPTLVALATAAPTETPTHVSTSTRTATPVLEIAPQLWCNQGTVLREKLGLLGTNKTITVTQVISNEIYLKDLFGINLDYLKANPNQVPSREYLKGKTVKTGYLKAGQPRFWQVQYDAAGFFRGCGDLAFDLGEQEVVGEGKVHVYLPNWCGNVAFLPVESTPTPTPTITPGGPTLTPTATKTPGPTNTVGPSPTPTRTNTPVTPGPTNTSAPPTVPPTATTVVPSITPVPPTPIPTSCCPQTPSPPEPTPKPTQIPTQVPVPSPTNQPALGTPIPTAIASPTPSVP